MRTLLRSFRLPYWDGAYGESLTTADWSTPTGLPGHTVHDWFDAATVKGALRDLISMGMETYAWVR